MVRGAAVAQRVTWAFPGDLATVTGGYAYDRRIISELEQLGWEIELVGLGDGFPRPNAGQKADAEARLLASRGDGPIVVDGLAFGVLPEVAATLRPRRPLVALVHHPLGLETGLTRDEATQLLASERNALASAHHVIATSNWTAELLAEQFGVSPERLHVVLPGTDRVPFSTGSGDETVRLLSVGAIGPRKAFDLLVEALAPLTHLPWHLTIAGDRERDVAAVTRLDSLIERHGLAKRIDCLGKVSPELLAALYAGANMFVLASRFEGYGMAFAEALAHGLPIIGTRGGATPHTVPASAGRLVAPGDVGALTAALQAMIGVGAVRRHLAAGARAAAATLPSWADSGGKFSSLLKLAT
jgi:glycosyltransferase involved in cell wall biosynthesis